MKAMYLGLATAALLSLTGVASAQTEKKPPPAPGQSEYAPGKRATEPGGAKYYAPGQRRQKKDDPRHPGASEYAPGQQPLKKPNKK